MLMPALFHWSPEDRRESILREGLKPYSPPPPPSEHLWPYICLGTTPSNSWSISGGIALQTEIEEWDLWQVRLAEGDEVHYRADFGPQLVEVRVRGAIPADRVWWVARRTELIGRKAS